MKHSPQRPWIIAHRGASAEYPENSIAAYQRAMDVGVDCIEIDLHLTSDLIPVCHHDPDIKISSFQGSPEIAKLPLEEIQEIAKGCYAIPSLLEVLQLERFEISLMLELKRGGAPIRDLVESVSQLVQATHSLYKGEVLLGSLCPIVSSVLSEKWPRSSRIGIVESATKLIEHKMQSPRFLALSEELFSPRLVKELVDEGFLVWMWTVDDPFKAKQMWAAGVSGIITNDPAMMRVAFSS